MLTTNERSAASLALLAPIACPLIDLICALARFGLYCWRHNPVRTIIDVERGYRAERRALASYRALLLNPPHVANVAPVMASVPTARIVYDVAAPVLGADDVVKVEPVKAPAPKRVRKASKPSKRRTAKREVITGAAANSPVVTPNACRCVATTKQGARCKRDAYVTSNGTKTHRCNQHKAWQPESCTLDAYVALLARNERADEASE
jgi:hypothetical protein